MSVLVDRKKPASYSGRSQNSVSIRSTAISKGKREVQQDEGFNSVSSSEIATAPVNRAGVAGAEERMNRKAVERVDSHVVELLSTVPQVVLYQYEGSSNTWVSLIEINDRKVGGIITIQKRLSRISLGSLDM